MMQLSGETLLGIRIFATLDAAARAVIARRCETIHAQAGSEVLSYGEDSRDVYFLIAGEVRATLYSLAGKEVAFRELGAGETFGDLSAIDGAKRCASIVALEPSTIAVMSAQQFRLTYREYPDVAEAVMRDLTALARSLTERIVEFSTLNVTNRIHSELVRLAQSRSARALREGIVIAAPPTHESIARRIGTQREAVTKELSRLRRRGLLSARPGGGWLIPDLAAVQALIGAPVIGD